MFWRFKEMLAKQKFQNEINMLKKQVSNNSYLWDQMAEAEKREKILKQELLFTQQSLAAAEKVIEKLQEEMRKYEAVQQRLKRYKDQNAERLKEYEDKLKKFEVYENIDTDKLINVLSKKDQEVTQLQGIADNFNEQINLVENRKDKEVTSLKSKFLKEQVKTQQIVEKMEQMKLELKMLESNDTSVAAIWKKKCLDLFEVCQTLKTENEDLRDRCKEVISQGIQLADEMNKDDRDIQSLNHGITPNTRLPKLLKNSSAQKMSQINYANQQNFNAKHGPPQTAGVTSGRQGSSTAGTFEPSSAFGGYGNYDA